MRFGEIMFILIVVIASIMVLFVRYREIKEYNNGICSKCGHKLREFDVDSQGGIGWACENPKCSHFLWTSWVKKKKVKK